MTPVKRDESQARTRAKLLEAGRRLVIAHGLAAASVRDIAEEAGFSQGAFYSNFASKEELLLEVMRAQKERDLAEVCTTLDAISDAAGARAVLDGWIASMCAGREWAVLAVELELHAARSAKFRRAYAALSREHVDVVGELIGRIFDAMGLVPPTPLADLATGYIALTHGLALQQPHLSAKAWTAIYRGFVDNLIAAAERLAGR